MYNDVVYLPCLQIKLNIYTVAGAHQPGRYIVAPTMYRAISSRDREILGVVRSGISDQILHASRDSMIHYIAYNARMRATSGKF